MVLAENLTPLGPSMIERQSDDCSRSATRCTATGAGRASPAEEPFARQGRGVNMQKGDEFAILRALPHSSLSAFLGFCLI